MTQEKLGATNLTMNAIGKSVREDLPQTTGQFYLLAEDVDKSAELRLLFSDTHYALQLFTDPADLTHALNEQALPAGIVIHTTFTDNDNAHVAAMAKLQHNFASLPPLVFISANDSISNRLTAVRAGGQHFLNEPVDQNSLRKILDQLLAENNDSRLYKVLMVDDDADQLRSYKTSLKDDRLILKTLAQPLDILNTLSHFQADAIVIRQRMSACCGVELGQVVRQNQSSISLPLIYLYNKADENLHIDASNVGSDTFLSQSIQPSLLIKAILAIAQRTDAERQLNQQLQESLGRSDFYNLAMDQHNIVSITGTDGRIIDVNDRFCTISGYRREELIGQNHRLIKSQFHDKAFYKEIWQTISTGEIWRGEICNLTKDGNEYWVSSTIVPFLDRKGKPWQYISVRTDITALHLSEDRLHRAQNFANIGTWDWNICSGYLHWSERVGPMFGYTEGLRETNFENYTAAIHPDDLPRVILAIEDCIEHGLEYNVEHRIIWPDGSVRWTVGSGDVIRNARGEAIRMLGVVRDITQHKAIELGLQQERRRLEEAQKIGAIGDWWLSFTDAYPHYSTEALRILGLKPSDKQLTAEETLEKIVQSDRKAITKDSRKVFRQGHSKIDFRIFLDNNTVRWVQMVRQATRDNAGKVTGFRGTMQDITERKEAEKQQQHNNRILEKIAKDAPLSETLSLLIEQAEAMQPDRFGAVLITDPVSGHLYCGAAPSLPHYLTTALDALKIDASQATHPEASTGDISNHPAWQRLHTVSQNTGFFMCSSKVIQSSSGRFLGLLLMYSRSPQTLSNSCALLTTELARFAAIAIEQKQVLWSLVEAKEEADNANQAKSQFLSHITHDLRTPLTAIMGFGQLLGMDKSSPLSQRQKDSVAEINKASEHLLDLINDILNLAQMESGLIELKLEAVNARELIAECEALIAPLAQERDIHFSSPHTEAHEPLPDSLFVEADRKRLKQVLLNLLSNAVKYNRHGGSITVNCQPTDNNLRIFITDTGEGLTENQQSQLFSAFERLEAENTNTKGSGIGLVVAKGLVENMSGTIGVESEPGKGSTFWVELPKALSVPKIEASTPLQ